MPKYTDDSFAFYVFYLLRDFDVNFGSLRSKNLSIIISNKCGSVHIPKHISKPSIFLKYFNCFIFIN